MSDADFEDMAGISDMESRITEELRSQAMSEAEIQDALDEHKHHLIRWTEATKTVDVPMGEGTIETTDVYCFTCEGWVGVSGIDLPGTPRSKADAHWRDGPPEGVQAIQEEILTGLTYLARQTQLQVDHINSFEQAMEFVTDQAGAATGLWELKQLEEKPT